MRVCLRLLLLQALLLVCVARTLAQSTAESLRAQLLDVEAKQAQLQERARQIDEELKPENIERSLALTGSTRPEELREQRRRQLEKEKESVRVQMDELAASHTRLDAAIATADAAAYRQGALNAAAPPAPVPQANNVTVQSSTPAQKQRRRRTRARPRRTHRRGA